MNTVMKDSLLMVLWRVAVKSVNFGQIFLVIYLCSAETVGIYGLYSTILFLVVAFASLGVRNAVVQNKDVSLASARFILNKVALPLGFLASVISVLLLILFYDFSNYLYIIPAALGVFFYMYLYLLQGYSLKANNVGMFNRLEVFPKIIFIPILMLYVFLSVDNELIFILLSLSYFFVAAGYYYQFSGIDLKEKITPLIKTGLPFAFGMALVLLNSRIPVFYSQFYEGEVVSGNVFSSIRIVDTLLEIANAVSLVVFARLATGQSIDRGVWRVAFLVVLIASVTAVVLAFYGGALLTTLSNGKLLLTDEVIKILAVGMPFAAMNKLWYAIYAGVGRVNIALVIYCVVVLLNLIGCYLGAGVEYIYIYTLVISQMCACIAFTLLYFSGSLKRGESA
jgi:O-antigen/teichoic acid export membrane protein